MSERAAPGRQAEPRTVLLDANVLMSRVQRDYFLYAAAEGMVDVKWSPAILEEMNRNLVAKRGVSQDGADRLQNLLAQHFPGANVEPGAQDFAAFRDVAMPDPDDRHVLAAAVASDASVLCTNNVKDFPEQATERVGVRCQRPDAVLDRLIAEHPETMAKVHRTTVDRNPRATSESTLGMLQKSGAPQAAARMEALINPAPATAEPGQSQAFEAQRLASLGFARPADQVARSGTGPVGARPARGSGPGPQTGQQR